MSEEIIPDVPVASDVPETVADAEAAAEESAVQTVNWAEKSLADLVRMFEELVCDGDRMQKPKEAEAIKSAFYRRLLKEKADAGFAVQASDEDLQDDIRQDEVSADNPFAQMEAGFKELYSKYKKERAEYNRRIEKERETNLSLKQAVIDDLKALLEKQEDVNATFPAFREIQNRWRAIGPVPVQNYRNINDTYQLYVEQFYDMVKINRELRDLDFRKNLEVKEEFCRLAEALSENQNVVEAFRELQKLHEQWKEFGPVAKEYREEIWDRFKAATSVINKKYQAFFEGQKEQQAVNLSKKTALCEKVEEIAEREVSGSNEWNAYSKEIEDVQKEWKTIGFASKKENQKIYDRFRAACDKFYGRKRDFYAEYKGSMNSNLEQKTALCEAAEELKSSTEWKKTTDRFITLQKQWKEIGPVPRKKSEQLWKRFRAACDEFFAERDRNAKPENDYYGNLKAKQRIIDEINAYEPKGTGEDMDALNEFQSRWSAIGFVPFKEKDSIADSYRDAVRAKFPGAAHPGQRGGRGGRTRQMSEKDRLVQKYNSLEQDIVTYENNMGFFSMSKNSEPLIRQMQERIDQAKASLKVLADQIRDLGEKEGNE